MKFQLNLSNINLLSLTKDFNYDLFMRHARLWKDHVFNSPQMEFVEVQRQMVMFITMYSMIDGKSFSFLDAKQAKNEWRRVRRHKESFLEHTLVRTFDEVQLERF